MRPNKTPPKYTPILRIVMYVTFKKYFGHYKNRNDQITSTTSYFWNISYLVRGRTRTNSVVSNFIFLFPTKAIVHLHLR